MPRYKLIFQDASWQDRKFISLTKTNDDGSSQILHCVARKDELIQLTFGSYAPAFNQKKLEFKPAQTTDGDGQWGEEVASEDKFCHLLNDDMMTKIFQDEDFLKFVEIEARNGNHASMINAALALQHGTCIETITDTDCPFSYRKMITERYVRYLLSSNGMHINADPEGMFTVIQYSDFVATHIANVNNLKPSREAAASIYSQLQRLIVSEYPPYPVIFQYRFIGQIVPDDRHVEITEPTPAQMQTVDALFDTAARNGFFPTNPQEMIQRCWRLNCDKIAKFPRRVDPIVTESGNYSPNLSYARTCLDAARPEEAIESATEFLSLLHNYDRQTAAWHYIYAKEIIAEAYKDLGDVANAGAHAEDAIRKYREMSYVPSKPLNVMAWVNYQNGKYKEALACIHESWESHNAESIKIAILSYTKLSKIMRAVSWGEYFLEKDQFKNDKQLALALLAAYQKQPERYAEEAAKLKENLNKFNYLENQSMFAVGNAVDGARQDAAVTAQLRR